MTKLANLFEGLTDELKGRIEGVDSTYDGKVVIRLGDGAKFVNGSSSATFTTLERAKKAIETKSFGNKMEYENYRFNMTNKLVEVATKHGAIVNYNSVKFGEMHFTVVGSSDITFTYKPFASYENIEERLLEKILEVSEEMLEGINKQILDLGKERNAALQIIGSIEGNTPTETIDVSKVQITSGTIPAEDIGATI